MWWTELEPLILACRPKAQTSSKELRRTASVLLYRRRNRPTLRAAPEEIKPWWQAARIFIRWARAGMCKRLLDRAHGPRLMGLGANAL
jgi:transposase